MLPLWLANNLYASMFWMAALEGAGLPMPAELLYLVAAERGARAVQAAALAGAAGNLAGSLWAYSMGYWMGPALIRLARRFHINTRRTRRFMDRYGSAAVFLSRFAGPVRTAATYGAGVARMAPWQFALYAGTAALLWNASCAALAYYVGRSLAPGLRSAAPWLIALALMLLLVKLWRNAMAGGRNRSWRS